MNITIKGAKAGAQQPRQPVIDLDSAQSKTFIKVLYGLSEGVIKGLAHGYKSVFLDDTPLQDANGNWNFQNVSVDFREGTNDQSYIEGFPDVSSETAIGIELKSETPWVRSFSNTDLDAIRIRFRWGPLRKQNESNGDVSGYTIRYAVDVQVDGGTWAEVLNTQISDKTSANYERSHRIDLPKADTGWQVRVRRLTPNTNSDFISDKMYIQAITEVIDAKLRYPNTALLGLRYDAQTFSNVAKMAAECEGIEILVPSNYEPESRQYTGLWDGTFKRAYTNNPAWHFYDVCISRRYALGNRINSSMIDKWSIYRLAQYCDQLVPDGKGGQEPRFTLNVYEQQQDDAWSVLSKMAGTFRAYIYWDGQAIVCDADIPQDTIYTFTSANVIDGKFEYSGTRARDRHTIAKVAYDNPANRYKTEYEIVRDEAAIAKYGIRIADIQAYGCTSQGQAQRAGSWALKSEQFETRTVTFKVGLDGFIPRPGKVIEVADPIFAGRANGGRISAVSTDLKNITVDRDDVVCRAGDRLVVNGEDGKAQARIVQSKNGRVITVVAAFEHVATQNVWVVDAQDLATMKFRVVSITQNERHQFTITGLQYNPAKFDAIDHGTFIDERPISIVNPNLQSPVESVSVSSEDMVQQGLTVASMLITWPQATNAVKYLVEWRKDDGSWIKLPITGNNSVEVQGIYSGNYQAKVTAINAFDVSSLPTYSILTELKGKHGTPPALAFIQAIGILFGMKLNWGFPTIGALDTAYTEIQVSPDGTSNIAQLGLFAYPTTTHTLQGLQPNLKQYYRGRLIDRIGNVGPWSTWTNATTSADASDILSILEGKIGESQLHQDLQDKIDKIEAIDTDLSAYDQRIQDAQNAADQANSDLAIERNERITAVETVANDIASESQTRITQIEGLNNGLAQERDERISAVETVANDIASESQTRITQIEGLNNGLTQEIQQREDGDANVLSVVNTYKESTDTSLAAVRDEINIVADDLSATSTKLDGVYAKVTPLTADQNSWTADSGSNQASSWSIQSAFADADSALGQRIDTVNAQVGVNQAAIQEERTARASGDEANASAINSYIAKNDTALASVRETADSAVTASTGNSSAIQALDSRVDVAEGDASEAKANAASAVTKAETAVTTAGSASSMAQQASASAAAATTTANNAANTANTANSNATEAKTNAATALTTANAAATQSSANTSQINSINASLADKASTGALESVKSDVNELDGRVTANTEKVDGVYAKVTPLTADQNSWTADSGSNQASSWSIQSAFADADSALGQRIDTVNAQVGVNQAAIQEERTARASGDEANASAINSYIAKNDTALASVRQTADSAVTASTSNSSAIQALDNRVDVAEGDASEAKVNAASAVTKAETAVTTAGSASSMAQQASASAAAATTTANNAANTANTANSNATEAKTNAATALTTANAAATQSSANASQINSINASLADKASTGALESVKSDVNELDGRVTANTEKVDGVYAKVTPLTADQNSWTADSGSNQASSWTIQSAFADADSALGQRIDTVNAQVGVNQAAIQEEVTARSTADSALGQRIDTVTAQVGSNTALIKSEETARTTADTALGQRIDTVQTEFDDNLATVQQQINAVSTAQSATASNVATIQTTVNGNTASIQDVSESVDGLYTQKYIKLDVNGKIAGWGGANDGVESQFIFNFDSLAIGNGDNGTVSYPFTFRTTPYTDPETGTIFPVAAYLKTAFMDYQSVKTSHIEDLSVKTAKIDTLAVTTGKIDNLAVTGAKIANLAVDTLKIQDNAVTVPVSAFAEANITIGVEYTTVQTLAVPSDMGHTILTFGAVFSFASYASTQQILCRVLKNDVVVFDDLEVYFTDYEAVGVTSSNSGEHGHNISVTTTGTMSSAGNHNHNFSGNTGSDGSHSHSISGGGSTYNAGNHNHSFSGNTGSNGSHEHNLNLSSSASMGFDGIHSHNVNVRGSARGAGTLNISRHDSTLIAGTFKLQLRAAQGGNVNVSQRYIHAMTMRK